MPTNDALGNRAPAELPQQFGRYQIRKKLGGRGMGAVYLTFNTELQREEALKVPHFERSDDPRVRERSEARHSRGFQHEATQPPRSCAARPATACGRLSPFAS